MLQAGQGAQFCRTRAHGAGSLDAIRAAGLLFRCFYWIISAVPQHISDVKGTEAPASAGSPRLHAETIENVVPLAPKSDADVPEALQPVLFDQPQSGRRLHTYAILDAAKVFGLAEDIAASGLKHRCLFTGNAAEELADVAPYLVALAPDARFTRHIFSHDPDSDVRWFFWSREPGLFLRSTANIDTIRAHFRKFTRIRDEAGKWFYFRFWEPRWTPTLLADMAPEDRADFFGPVTRFIAPRFNGPCTVLSLAAAEAESAA